MIDQELLTELLLFYHRKWKENPTNITRLNTFNATQETPIDDQKLEANARYMIEHGLLTQPRITGFLTRISKYGVHKAESLVYSPDVSIREKILLKLKQEYDKNPTKQVQGDELETNLGFSKIEILRNLMILEYDGYIDLQLYGSGESYSRIKARGIDVLSKPVVVNYEAEIMKRAYEKIYTLENSLRRFLEKELYNEYGDDWWEKGVTKKVRDEASELKERENGEEPEINYTLFPHLRLIIIKEDNWKNRFEPVFITQRTVLARLEELEPIRNKIAHSRMLNEDEIQNLDLLSREILDKIF